jgi:hypothetical protein
MSAHGFVLSNLNLHISSNNMVDSDNSNKQSQGSSDRGSEWLVTVTVN